MRNRRIIMGIVITAAALVCAACLICCQVTESESTEGKPLIDLLNETGFEGSSSEWFDSLSDEEKAAIDIAFESSTASGYQGSKDDWLAEKARARFDNNGDVVVMLPDGGSFTLSGNNKSDSKRAQSSAIDSTQSSSKSSNSKSDKKNKSEASSKSSKENGGAYISVDSVTAHPGDRDVVVAVRIKNNPGILGLTLSLSYDESALSLKSAESGDAFKDVLSMTQSRSLGTGCLFNWDGVEISKDDIKDGVIANFHFDVSGDAKAGVYPIVVQNGLSAVSNDLQEVSLTVEDGSVVVE